LAEQREIDSEVRLSEALMLDVELRAEEGYLVAREIAPQEREYSADERDTLAPRRPGTRYVAG
jgi:hypothetical protein